jgi:hypothetical protein
VQPQSGETIQPTAQEVLARRTLAKRMKPKAQRTLRAELARTVVTLSPGRWRIRRPAATRNWDAYRRRLDAQTSGQGAMTRKLAMQLYVREDGTYAQLYGAVSWQVFNLSWPELRLAGQPRTAVPTRAIPSHYGHRLIALILLRQTRRVTILETRWN